MTAQRPSYRPYLVHVLHTRMLSPYMKRLVVQGDDVQYFGTDGYDQRIKLILPRHEQPVWADTKLFDPESIQAGAWYQQWRALDPATRNPVRTYTIRSVDQQARTCTIDMVMHTPAGPAGRFAAQAQVGDELVIVGPDARSEDSGVGIDFHVGTAAHVLLIGDETALPAIGGIIDSLERDHWQGTVVAAVEIPEDNGMDYLRRSYRGMQVQVHWLPRIGQGKRVCGRGDGVRQWITDQLPSILGLACDVQYTSDTQSSVPLEHIDIDTQLLWEVPQIQSSAPQTALDLEETEYATVEYCSIREDPQFGNTSAPRLADPSEPWDELWCAWVAGEAAMVRDVRRYLVQELHMDRKRVAFMGYWREGRGELS